MARRMRISRPGIELIKSFEGFRARSEQLPDGRWIIGHGHTRAARKNLRINHSEAELILRYKDLPPIERAICDHVLTPLTLNEFDALVSFVFNIGIESFKGSETLKLLNEGNRLAAADAMATWRKARIKDDLRVVDALVRRRAAEVALFLQPETGWVALSSAVVAAELDTMSAGFAPRERAVIVDAPTEPVRPPAPRMQTAHRESEDEHSDAPRAAARAVTERLTRILGENASLASGEANASIKPEQVANDVHAGQGPSVDEITRAISALAEPENQTPPPPKPPEVPPAEAMAPLPPVSDIVVDDLETVDVDEQDRLRAQKAYEQFKAEERVADLMAWLPFVILCGIGLAGIVYGLRDFFVPHDPAHAITTANDLKFGPVLMLGGLVLTAISGYYLARGILDRD